MNSRHIRRLTNHKRNPGRGLAVLRLGLLLVAASLLALVVMLALTAGTIYTVYASYVQELPSAEEIRERSVQGSETTRIYDRTGEHILYEIVPPEGGRRTWVTLEEIPEHLRDATVAMEDKNFYDETLYTNFYGINVEGVGRAIFGELSGDDRGGGSSIPQQLVKLMVFETFEERAERSYLRKLQEWILTIELTRRYPGIEGREQILEAYLNNIFYGHFAVGVEAAAQTYFGKPVQELTLAECAMLVPLGQAPALNPISAPEEAKRRQETVLDTMFLRGYISSEEAYEAKQQPIVVQPPVHQMLAPHWVLYVRSQLEQRFGAEAVYGGGLQVITTLDLDIQREAERIAREHIAEIRESSDAGNAAIVVIDAKTAQIVAMVGSLDYNDESIDGNINMALSPRQPGSSFKPFTYATAFAQGYTPATMVMDVRTSFPDPPNPPYVPENFTRRYKGPILLREALASSYNIPAVAMMHKVGAMNVVDLAHAMGIETLGAANYGLALTLGGGDVRLVDMVYAYSVFANGGAMLGEPKSAERFRAGYRQLDPVTILQVRDSSGELLYAHLQPERREVLSPEVAYLISDVLSDNQARAPGFGAGSVLVIPDRPAAVKTGTTNNFHDSWAVGYTPQYVVGVWSGNADYTAMRNATGVRTSGPIWQQLMLYLHEGKPVESFVRPPGIVMAVVDSTSGKLPTEHSPSRRQELFIEGTVPTTYDDVHKPFAICRASGKLATVYCPAEEVEVQVFTIYPPEADDWVRDQGIAQPPTQFCDLHGPTLASADVAITSPRSFGAVSGVVSILGNARADSQERFWLEVGRGVEPTEWTPITPEHGHRVENDLLATWDASGLDGLYTLQLVVIDGGMRREVRAPVIVDNQPPQIQLRRPNPAGALYNPAAFQRDEDRTYEAGYDEWINIQVEATDNISISHIEFYMNGHLVGTSTVAPYTVRVMFADLPGGIENREALVQEVGALPELKPPSARAQSFVIHVVAYDTAGNRTVSAPVDAYYIPR
jgi:penicillin-binding protein 1C